LIGDAPDHAARATALMKRVEKGKHRVIVTDEVLTETVWTLESFYKVPPDEIAERLIALLALRGLQVSSRAIFTHALQLFASTGTDFVDCLLAARGSQQNIPVYTFDETDFRKLPVSWESP
jgi:predicted nucleic-acid-binding protein